MKLIFGLAKEHYDDIANILARYPEVDKVLIYGSRAKGTGKPSSDFDLAVFAPNLDDLNFSKLWNELSNLDLIFKFDILHWDKLENAKLKQKILNEGKPFYPLEV